MLNHQLVIGLRFTNAKLPKLSGFNLHFDQYWRDTTHRCPGYYAPLADLSSPERQGFVMSGCHKDMTKSESNDWNWSSYRFFLQPFHEYVSRWSFSPTCQQSLHLGTAQNGYSMSSQLLLKPLYTVDMAIIKQLLSSKVFWEKIGASLSFRSGFCVFFHGGSFSWWEMALCRCTGSTCLDVLTVAPRSQTKNACKGDPFFEGSVEEKQSMLDHGLQLLKQWKKQCFWCIYLHTFISAWPVTTS